MGEVRRPKVEVRKKSEGRRSGRCGKAGGGLGLRLGRGGRGRPEKIGGGWRTPRWSRDVVTNRILPRFFFKKAVTKAVTSRDRAVTSRTRTVGWIDGFVDYWLGELAGIGAGREWLRER